MNSLRYERNGIDILCRYTERIVLVRTMSILLLHRLPPENFLAAVRKLLAIFCAAQVQYRISQIPEAMLDGRQKSSVISRKMKSKRRISKRNVYVGLHR
jgi:hypothetical protein